MIRLRKNDTELYGGNMKKNTAVLLAFMLICQLVLPVLSAPAEADVGTAVLEQKNYPVYLGSIDDALPHDYPLYFAPGASDLPYVDLYEFVELLMYVNRDYGIDNGYSLTASAEGHTLVYERESKYTARFDFEKNTIFFTDFDAFIHSSNDTTVIDLLSESGFDEQGQAELYQRDLLASFDRYGDEILLDLNHYGIRLVEQNGRFFVPLQTMNDFLISPRQNVSFLFNGKALILGNRQALYQDGELTPLGEYYYAVPSVNRSDALAEYSYNELCLVLDSLYGLKEAHDIESFSKLFWEIGFDEPLRSNDPQEADLALYQFITYYLDDLHSAFNLMSCYCDHLDIPEELGAADRNLTEKARSYDYIRSAAMPDGVPEYEEVGNTAYITFDSFDSKYYARDYYTALEAGTLLDDTVGLIIYANAMIRREDSPVENVVLDLTNNTGGAVDAAVAVLGWFLGDAPFSVKDTFTGALSTSVYRVDLDLDREIDEWDTVFDKNLYCLISPVSFSCGNLVPAALKASQWVTLIGRTSGGGSCAVQPLSTAYGTLFQISGPYRMSFLKNGSFYDIDQGSNRIIMSIPFITSMTEKR